VCDGVYLRVQQSGGKEWRTLGGDTVIDTDTDTDTNTDRHIDTDTGTDTYTYSKVQVEEGRLEAAQPLVASFPCSYDCECMCKIIGLVCKRAL